MHEIFDSPRGLRNAKNLETFLVKISFHHFFLTLSAGQNVGRVSPSLYELKRMYQMTQHNGQMDKAKQLTTIALNDPNISKEDKK